MHCKFFTIFSRVNMNMQHYAITAMCKAKQTPEGCRDHTCCLNRNQVHVLYAILNIIMNKFLALFSLITIITSILDMPKYSLRSDTESATKLLQLDRERNL